MAENIKEKKILKPNSNILQISTRRDAKFYLFLSKIFLKSYETIELHALGEAIALCTRVGETLTRTGFTTVIKTEIFTYEAKEEDPGKKKGKKVKMIIKLERSKDFLSKTANIQE